MKPAAIAAISMLLRESRFWLLAASSFPATSTTLAGTVVDAALAGHGQHSVVVLLVVVLVVVLMTQSFVLL